MKWELENMSFRYAKFYFFITQNCSLSWQWDVCSVFLFLIPFSSHSPDGKGKEINICTCINVSHMHKQGIPHFRLKFQVFSKVQKISSDHNLLLRLYSSAEHLFYHIVSTNRIIWYRTPRGSPSTASVASSPPKLSLYTSMSVSWVSPHQLKI